jgi:GNAT superfamily N-acetyltransferase
MERDYRLRRARPEDAQAIREMHSAALTGLAGDHYTPAEIDGFLADVETVDAALIRDGTYYVIEQDGALAASGGWTMRRPSYVAPSEEPWLWSPGTATIRAIFTDPGHARKGLAGRVMELAEDEAVIHGAANRIVLCATMAGLPLYLKLGYRAIGAKTLQLSNGAKFPNVAMMKTVSTGARCPGPVVPAIRAPAPARVAEAAPRFAAR